MWLRGTPAPQRVERPSPLAFMKQHGSAPRRKVRNAGATVTVRIDKSVVHHCGWLRLGDWGQYGGIPGYPSREITGL